MPRLFLAFGSGFALIAVITGAFAAQCTEIETVTRYVPSF